MSSFAFMNEAKKAVYEWLAQKYASNGKPLEITWQCVSIVWQVKVLKNHRAILAAPTPDNYLFDVTYGADKNELHVGVYDMVEHRCTPVQAE